MKKKYPIDTVAVQNRVRDCYKGFTLDEKRLFVLATPLARVTELFGNEPIFVSAEDFAKETGTDIRTAYKALEKATKRLFDRHFSYTEDSGKRSIVRWTWKTSYDDGGAYLYFTEDVLTVLRQLDKDNPYTKYKKEIVLRLRKDYSLGLYHLSKKHLNMGKFSIHLNNFFELLELPEKYLKRKDNLKSRVLEPSIAEINENTDITLSYENIKRGRKIIGFLFTVDAKQDKQSDRDTQTVDMFAEVAECDINGMSAKQAKYYASKLSRLHEVTGNWDARSYEEAETKLTKLLQKPENVVKYLEYLKNCDDPFDIQTVMKKRS